MTDLEVRVALLERNEKFYQKIFDDTAEFRQKIWGAFGELNEKFTKKTEEMKAEIAEIRLSIAEIKGDMKKELNALAIKIGFIIAIGAILAPIVFTIVAKKLINF